MTWLQAIDGSIKKWERIREVVASDEFCSAKQYGRVRGLIYSKCPMCVFRDDTVEWGNFRYPFRKACDNCIAGAYFNVICMDLQEFYRFNTILCCRPRRIAKIHPRRESFQNVMLEAVDDILTRLNELKYWLVNVRG